MQCQSSSWWDEVDGLKMEMACSSEILVKIYQTAPCHIPEPPFSSWQVESVSEMCVSITRMRLWTVSTMSGSLMFLFYEGRASVEVNYFLFCSETVLHMKNSVTGWWPILMQHLWVGGCSQSHVLLHSAMNWRHPHSTKPWQGLPIVSNM